MKSEILLEIRRFKEIMGITPNILNEQPLPFLKSLMKSSGKTLVKDELKQYLETFARTMDVSTDEAFEAFSKDYYEALAKNSDTDIAKVFDDYFGVASKQYADDLIEIYAKLEPQAFNKMVINVELGSMHVPLYEKWMNSTSKVTEKNFNSVNNLLDNVNYRRENIFPLNATDQASKGVLDDFAETLQTKLDEYSSPSVKVSTNIDDIYDALVLKGSRQTPPVKFPTLEEIAAAESKLKQNFKSPEEAFRYYEKTYGSTKGYAETMETIEKNAKATGKAVSPFIKGLGWTGVALIIGGFISYNLFVTSEDDAEDMRAELVQRCGKLADKSAVQSDWRRIFSQYRVVVAYNNSLVTAVKEDNWKLDINGVKIPLDCNDPKLGVGDISTLLTNEQPNDGGGTTTKQTLETFLTGPDYGFKSPITFPGITGDNSTTVGDGTYEFTDSTPESDNGPLTGKVKVASGVLTYES
jgi:hypothetical protein